jgi:hypothetical protein
MERVGNTAAGLAGDAKKMAGQAIGNEQMQRHGDEDKTKASAKCVPAFAAAQPSTPLSLLTWATLQRAPFVSW